MKTLKFFITTTLIALFLTSCASVNVNSDYDSKTNFNKYKTFAFYKKGIDKSKISDIDKKRILRAIENELTAKGMTKSKNPDMLVSIFAKSQKKVDVYRNGYYPGYYSPYMRNNYSKYTEGTLLIDLIDTKTKSLLWQGIGKGALSNSKKVARKEERINEFVSEIMKAYPPTK